MPPRPGPVVQDDGPGELTEEQAGELGSMLEVRRRQLVTSIERRRGQGRELVVREVGDEMDEATTEGATSMASKLLERDVQLLREIDHALDKVAGGTYGTCEGTGEPIGYARLKLRPWARYSIEYQEEMERAARSRGTT